VLAEFLFVNFVMNIAKVRHEYCRDLRSSKIYFKSQ
jgi:hypothetical protein